eukprot:13807414-Alexandrium_andersonii.AAC.1
MSGRWRMPLYASGPDGARQFCRSFSGRRAASHQLPAGWAYIMYSSPHGSPSHSRSLPSGAASTIP